MAAVVTGPSWLLPGVVVSNGIPSLLRVLACPLLLLTAKEEAAGRGGVAPRERPDSLVGLAVRTGGEDEGCSLGVW